MNITEYKHIYIFQMTDPSTCAQISNHLFHLLIPPSLSFHNKIAEAFGATEEDIAAPMHGRNKPIALGQVGIRCMHCKRKYEYNISEIFPFFAGCNLF